MKLSHCLFLLLILNLTFGRRTRKCLSRGQAPASFLRPFKIEYQFQRNEYAVPDFLDEKSVVLRQPEYDLKPRFKTNSVANVIPMKVSCSSTNVTSALKELRENTKCVPRDGVVNLKAPEGYMISPNTVMVKKCGGMCNGAKSCLSNSTREVEFYVRSVNFATNEVVCSSILVPEDTSCLCACETKITDCLPAQKYDKNMCACRCTNTEDYQDCLRRSYQNFNWDEKSCRCICSITQVCTTGSHWIPSQCRCARLYP